MFQIGPVLLTQAIHATQVLVKGDLFTFDRTYLVPANLKKIPFVSIYLHFKHRLIRRFKPTRYLSE